MKIKGTYHCQTTQQPNTLNGWDIRSVSVDLPEVQDKPYWHKVAVAVIGFVLVLLSGIWCLGIKNECCHRAATLEHSN